MVAGTIIWIVLIFGIILACSVASGSNPNLKNWFRSLSLNPKNRISRGDYTIIGTILAALKWNIDRFIISQIVKDGYFNAGLNFYLFPPPKVISVFLSGEHQGLFVLLGLLTLVFIGIGTSLTIQRLRDCGAPIGLVVLFFFPIINIFFFLLLCLLPSAEKSQETETGFLERILPKGKWGSATLAVAVAALLSALLIAFSASILKNYGLGLFIGIPFMAGLLSVSIFSYGERRLFTECMAVSLLAVFILGLVLLATAVEGLMCIVMAAPIGAVLAAIGGLLGYLLQLGKKHMDASKLSLAVFPVLVLLEGLFPHSPERFSVSTEQEINAPINVVWKNVVEFSEIPPPTEWLFKTGVSYPVRARIDGYGVGAIRYCEFTTGAFVEPITVWNEPTLLKFSVTSTPPPMVEWSPYHGLKPTHLSGFFLSKEGQFALEKISENRTRLVGTTWYEHRIFPQYYWRLWSQPILHGIHQRVLDHIRGVSEKSDRLPAYPERCL